MQQNEKKRYLQILKGAIFGTLILLISVLIFALILYKTEIKDGFYKILMAFCVILSGFSSGYISVAKYKRNGLLTGLISSIISASVLLITMIIANKGFDLYMLIPEILLFASGTFGGVAGVNIKTKSKKR